ncbi:acyl-CoA/acyl-ACP dehydrogenase [Streptosporangiaceae bacterium NEAU-GS5]|nr:acyl-CoA/acyl-ACP dehydrogenase [Streptosporangiaceae bacterium NEAU-GS5]
MDFNLDETQGELRDLARDVLSRDDDAGSWKAFAQAGLLGAALPEEAGGAGLGAVEMAVLLRETGQRVTAMPALACLVAGQVIGRYGTAAQKAALAPVAEGSEIVTFGWRDVGAPTREEGGRLTGRKTMVPYASQASRILVSADTGLFLVDVEATAVQEMPFSTGEPGAVVTLDGTPGERVDGPAVALGEHATAGITATASGVLAGALALTTDYIKTRKQFGRALAEFQAVTVQIADVYIAARALDVAMWSAVWRLAEGLPAAEDLALAAYNMTDGALKALYTCQHLHGGIGLDVTYPLHRYFAWGSHAAHQLGGVEAQLDQIGALCSSN